MSEPTFGLVNPEIQQAVWFEHECPNPAFGDFDRKLRRVQLPLGGNGWTLVSETPLTITPSILSSCCGIHGFITDGKWVSV